MENKKTLELAKQISTKRLLNYKLTSIDLRL